MTMKGLNYPTKDELSYTTSEEDTGTTWIDGSAIYKKTIDFGALPNATSKNVAHNISDLGQVVKIEGIAIAGNRAFSLPHVDDGSVDTNIRITVEGPNIQIRNGLDRSSWHGYVTLYYTKAEASE